MTNRGLLLKMGLLSAFIALFGWVPRVSAEYVNNANGAALIGEFRAFVGDFSSWDAKHEYMPLLALEATPSEDRLDMVILLWWLWLLEQRDAQATGGAIAFAQNPNYSGDSSSHLSPPNGLGNPSPVGSLGGGTIVPLPTPPIGIRPGDDDNPSGSLGNGISSGGPIVSPPTPPIGIILSGGNGDDPSGSLGDGTSSGGPFVPLPTPPIGIVLSGGNGDDPSGSLGDGISSGSPIVQIPDPPSPDIASVPEPSAFALFGCGTLGLLTYGCARWRMTRWGRRTRSAER